MPCKTNIQNQKGKQIGKRENKSKTENFKKMKVKIKTEDLVNNNFKKTNLN